MTSSFHSHDAAAPPALEAVAVVAGYGTRTILQGLDLSIAAGEIYALLGANGAGKTTTLSLFLGFVRPTRGRVRVNGIDPGVDPTTARRRLAYIPENVALYDHLSARENVAYLLDLAGEAQDAPAIDEALSAAGLDRAAHGRRVSGFSKGMRQKVSIALALARRVPVLLLDEPTSGLDPLTTGTITRLIQKLQRELGVTSIVVSHDIRSVFKMASRVAVLHERRVTFFGTPEEMTASEDPYLHDFLGA